MTLRETLPSLLSDTADRRWPTDVHYRHGALVARGSDGDHLLTDLCDRAGDAVVVTTVSGAVVAVVRVTDVEHDHGLLRVVTTGTPSGARPTRARIASRHALARAVPMRLCTAGVCLCPAVDLAADVRAGDVLALVSTAGTTGTAGTAPIVGPAIDLSGQAGSVLPVEPAMVGTRVARTYTVSPLVRPSASLSPRVI
ncbi:hypothetical protein [Rhodococcoides corynebacterioides]|uniref:Uncharacterized protein n=1 Tax=Rhodococcoides corynebacterioides TaxID=53972 RepID=A0ABS7P498_9NOCA|nr:hypothetical protein [Rhodococcus corynebacterioides]MBY6367242.1 hypothetical protein [Rhodococcus corynebacterioides]MBY6408785.1 hypothetical protein [Rhodococcus corynebacterioides]